MSLPAPPSRAVSSAIWWVVSIAVCVISAIGLTDAGYSQPAGSLPAIALWVSLAIVVIGLALEAWRDLFETAKYLAWMGASTAAFCAFVGLHNSSSLALTVAGVTAVIWAVSMAYRMWNQSAASAWPDMLLQRFDIAAVHEVGGIQFTGEATATITGGQACEIELFVQNCFDAPRTIHLELEPEAKVADSNRAVLVPDDVKAELAPGEVAKVILTCVAVGRAQGTHVYLWRVGATGQGGHRVRRRRAPSLTVPLVTELISLFSALSLGARGRKVTLSAKPGPTDVLQTRPTFRVEPLWRPPE